MNCTFIGLGNMGRELCSRIGSAGFHTFAYDLNLAASQDARSEWEQQARDREDKRREEDALRLENLQTIEQKYREKQAKRTSSR